MKMSTMLSAVRGAAVGAIVVVLSSSLRADGDLEQKATWALPDVTDVRAQLEAFLEDQTGRRDNAGQD